MEEKKKFHLSISFNSPVILSFTIICGITLLLNQITGGASNDKFFSVYHSSFHDPLTYFRMIGHVLGHANLEHFVGNFMMILIVGPLLEEKYGSQDIFVVILVTALVTGLANYFFFPRYQVLGASGVVFALILLSSFTSFKNGTIPLTFILVAILYIGKQVWSTIAITDNISNFSHIVGGCVGGILGFFMNPNLEQKSQDS